jgi:CYTH domain-containing protein
MGTEIERKFLVTGEAWRSLGPKTLYRQGYLPSQDPTTVRVRIVDQQAYLTIKGQNTGLSRLEFEYAIPLADAQALLENLCRSPLIEKYRYRIPWRGFLWEVDEFLGENAGLILAEVELESETQNPPLPDWLGPEVSHDPRYYNSNLAQHPFRTWV